MTAYGYLFAAFSIGFCISPIIGGYIADYLSNAQVSYAMQSYERAFFMRKSQLHR
jgi:MFS family permease